MKIQKLLGQGYRVAHINVITSGQGYVLQKSIRGILPINHYKNVKLGLWSTIIHLGKPKVIEKNNKESRLCGPDNGYPHTKSHSI